MTHPKREVSIKEQLFHLKKPEKILLATNEALEIYNHCHKTHYWHCMFCWSQI